jgi:phage terminase large subunit GpA-like protein
MKTRIKNKIITTAIKYFEAKSTQPIWKWAEENIILTEEHGQYPGPLNTALTPWIREPLEWMCADHEVTDIALRFASQTAKTLCEMIAMSYQLSEQQRSILFVMPSEDQAKDFSQERWQPLASACKPLAAIKTPEADKYRKLDMLYGSAWLNLVGSNSPGNVASRPRPIVYLAECDKLKDASKKESSAAANAAKRTKTFAAPKRIYDSTPTTETGKINIEYEAGNQCHWQVPCPHCGTYIELLLEQIKWDTAAKTEDGWDLDRVNRSAHYQCQNCGGTITDAHKTKINLHGKHVPTNPIAPKHRRSTTVPSWVAPWPDTTFGRTAVKYLEALRTYNMQDFDTNERGIPYRVDARKLDHETLLDRREDYPALPPAVVLRTAFIDIQDDRLEYIEIGWGAGLENWLLQLEAFIGDPGLPAVWDELHAHLIAKQDSVMPLSWCFIDHGGHFPQDAAEFALKCHRTGLPHVHLQKGDNVAWSPVLGRATHTKTPRCRLYYTGVDSAKLKIMSLLNTQAPEAEGQQNKAQSLKPKAYPLKPIPGYCHLPAWLTEEQAKQLCAEEIREKHNHGETIKYWYQTNKRNELLDGYVGCYAALKRLGETYYSRRISRSTGNIHVAHPPTAPATTETTPPEQTPQTTQPPPPPPPPKRQPSNRQRQPRRGWINQ